MSQVASEEKKRSVVLIVLATIGGLSLLAMIISLALLVWVIISFYPAPSIALKDGVGVLEIDGMITEAEPAIKAIREFKKNDRVKAMVVRIDSPGGTVGASQEIFEEIKRLDREKPVVASFATIATSGGYYAALGARYIFADPGTITGSIGVIMTQPNLESMLDKLGIKINIIKSGSFKDLTPLTRELSLEEKALLEGVLKDIHKQFIKAVSDSRKIPIDAAYSLSDGRIFTGNQALSHHLVDELGNFTSAVEKAASFAKIEDEPELIYPKKERFDLLREILEDNGASTLAHTFFKLFAHLSHARALYAP